MRSFTWSPVSFAVVRAIAAVVAADGLVVATPVLLAVHSGSRRQPPDIGSVLRDRLTGLYAKPVLTVVVAGRVDWEESASGGSSRLREHIGQAAAELAAEIHAHRR